ncbi:MAG: RnfABCDGE type electron transport complex subunit D [Oscillospiraceae bacterium]|nr:RnfABCDGE type electron transport complex subunit D [Oscillospiraceae bacterium]
MIKKRFSRPLRRQEYWVVIAAFCIVCVCFYGIRAAAVLALAAVTAVATDFVCLFLRGRSYRRIDLSNVGYALILAMMFPATIPYSILMLSTIFATAVGSHVFGYRRDHLFPPPALGYLFALISWRKSVLNFPPVGADLHLFHNPEDLEESFSVFLNKEGLEKADLYDTLLGFVRTPMGTGCILLLLVCGLVLLFRGQLDPWKFLGCLLGMSLAVFLYGVSLQELLAANMVLFSLLFLISDPAVNPCTPSAGWVGAAVVGLFTSYLISAFGMEYAPVIAVILGCPLWRGLGMLEQHIIDSTDFSKIRIPFIDRYDDEEEEDEDGE